MNTIELNKKDLKHLNLIDDRGNVLLSNENLTLLKQGKQTDDILLKGVKFKDKTVDLNASLSAYKENGVSKLRIHPYYRELENNQLLTEQERNYIAKHTGTHSKFTNVSGEIESFGDAKYKFDDNQQNSYFVKLKTDAGTETIWGVMLREKMENYKQGDKVTIKYTGKEKVTITIPVQEDGKTVHKPVVTDRNNFSVTPYNEKNDYRNNHFLIEYNEQKKSFEIIGANKVPKVKAINGVNLTKEQQEKLEKGEEITYGNSRVQYSPKKQTFVQRNNNKLLVASLLVDGGLSYAIIKAVEYYSNKKNATLPTQINSESKEVKNEKLNKTSVNVSTNTNIESEAKQLERSLSFGANGLLDVRGQVSDNVSPFLEKYGLKEDAERYAKITKIDPNYNNITQETESFMNEFNMKVKTASYNELNNINRTDIIQEIKENKYLGADVKTIETEQLAAKEGIDKQYIRDLEDLKNEIDEKMRQSDNKNELSDIKDFISSEINSIENTSYIETDLEERYIDKNDIEDDYERAYNRDNDSFSARYEEEMDATSYGFTLDDVIDDETKYSNRDDDSDNKLENDFSEDMDVEDLAIDDDEDVSHNYGRRR